MIDNLSFQKRVLIATILAVIFFIGYDYFYLSKIAAQRVDANQTALASNEDIKSPRAKSTQNSVNQDLEVKNSGIKSKNIASIKSPIFHAKIDELGRISSFILDNEIYKDEKGTSLNLVDLKFAPLPLEIRFADESLNERAFKTPYTSSVSNLDIKDGGGTIVLLQDLGEVKVEKHITFYPNGKYDIAINLSKEVEYFITPGFRPNIAVDGYTVHGAIIKTSDDKLTILKDGSVDTATAFKKAKIAAASDRYYTALFYDFNEGFDVVLSEDRDENAQVFIHKFGNFKASGYIGPKEQKTLESIHKDLTSVIEYGWFTFIAKPMFKFLSYIYNYVHNWGWAIVVLTIIVRIVLAYPTYKGMISMNKMKDLAPKMKEIQEKYKDDKAKMQAHVMELYRKHGANPMGGCLPILLQIPIFFAIYRVLLNAIELKGAEWILWIDDLAVKDPYFILPIIMGLMMFIQQRLTPTNFTDPMQEKIMKYLPLIFVLFFVTFPAGLTLYWCVNNTCSVIQQLIVNRLFEKHKQMEREKNENRG